MLPTGQNGNFKLTIVHWRPSDESLELGVVETSEFGLRLTWVVGENKDTLRGIDCDFEAKSKPLDRATLLRRRAEFFRLDKKMTLL